MTVYDGGPINHRRDKYFHHSEDDLRLKISNRTDYRGAAMKIHDFDDYRSVPANIGLSDDHRFLNTQIHDIGDYRNSTVRVIPLCDTLDVIANSSLGISGNSYSYANGSVNQVVNFSDYSRNQIPVTERFTYATAQAQRAVTSVTSEQTGIAACDRTDVLVQVSEWTISKDNTMSDSHVKQKRIKYTQTSV